MARPSRLIRASAAAGVFGLALLAAGACEMGGGPGAGREGRGEPAPVTSSLPPTPAGDTPAVEVTTRERPRGGSARVGVWAEPDPAAATLGGSAVRALVLPQLFVARPDGRWSPALVDPGSDRLAADRRSASFRMRSGAVWSEGSPIGVDDLRRSADPRFVAAVEGPDASARITVTFTQELPGWRRLWSGTESISPPAPDVWGGPFVVASVVKGLETVLRPNERWWGGRGPFLDEVRLVLVPDSTTARLLLARGEIDVVMPPAGTARRPQLERIDGVSLDRVARGAWWVALLANPAQLSLEDRRALFATVDRQAFVTTLLAGEAALLNGFAGPEDGIWAGAGVGDAGQLKGDTVDLVGMVEEPMTGLLHRSMQKRARSAGGTIELRQAEADRVVPWVRESKYGAAVVLGLDPPGGCWRCRWEQVDGALATAADAGDAAAIAALEARLRDEALVLPLWSPEIIVAWRDGLGGVKANGFGTSGAWNAWEWWRGR